MDNLGNTLGMVGTFLCGVLSLCGDFKSLVFSFFSVLAKGESFRDQEGISGYAKRSMVLVGGQLGYLSMSKDGGGEFGLSSFEERKACGVEGKNRRRKYRLLIFDFDGTLLDSVAHIVRCVQLAARRMGFKEPTHSFIQQGIGLGYQDQFSRLFPEVKDEARQEAFHRCCEAYFREADGRNRPQLVEGAMELLSYLRAEGFLLAIATSMHRHTLLDLLAEFGVESFFDTVRCGDQGLSKPHPQMVLAILEELGVSGGEALMIGDTEYDMYMAERAAIDCVGVTYGVHGVDRLRSYSPIACIDKLSDLSDYVFES